MQGMQDHSRPDWEILFPEEPEAMQEPGAMRGQAAAVAPAVLGEEEGFRPPPGVPVVPEEAMGRLVYMGHLLTHFSRKRHLVELGAEALGQQTMELQGLIKHTAFRQVMLYFPDLQDAVVPQPPILSQLL
jgi:hypothetical protein